jgi:hypothetical protein
MRRPGFTLGALASSCVAVLAVLVTTACSPPQSKRGGAEEATATTTSNGETSEKPTASEPAKATTKSARNPRVPAPEFVVELGTELMAAIETNEPASLQESRLPFATYEQPRWRKALAKAKGAERIPADAAWRMMNGDSLETERWLIETYGGQNLQLLEADVEDVDVRPEGIELWARPRFVVGLPDGTKKELRVVGEIVRDTKTGEAWILRFDTWR